MKILEAKLKELDFKLYKRRSAKEEDCSILITDDTLVTENGKPKILYCKIHEDTSAMRWAVKTIKYIQDIRSNGLKTNSAVFGFSPKIVMRKDFCSTTAMNKTHPKQHYTICQFSKELTKYYEQYFPEILKEHYAMTDQKVKEQWKLEGTPFTSGIVNKNNPLKYHHDAGNFKNVLSNMIVFKNGVLGGHLACPEYDIKFECDDNHVVIFDGQQILHGVTPIRRQHELAYRYSVVYYSLEQMWKCDTVNEEVSRIRKIKKEREFKRLENQSD